MRVTAVTTWFPTTRAPARGSFVVRDVHAIAALPEVDEVRLVHLVPPADDDGTRRLVHEGIEVLRIPMTVSDPRSIVRAARALRSAVAGTDVVHTMALSSVLPMVLCRPRAVWVHTEHWSALTTPASLSGPARAALPALVRLLRRPDAVTAVCELLARPIRAVRGAAPTAVVPCIVEPGPLTERRDRADGALRLVSTGGLIERKDPLVAVATVAELAARGVDVHLTWLGDGPLREATLERARSLGVADRVALPGNVDGERVRAELGGADLFFGPTRADNFFVSAAEALVAGRPVVLGATGGQGEYVRASVGRLVDVQDPVAYADAIVELDAATRDLSAEQIAATIGDAFSSAAVGRRYGEIYAQMLQRTPRPGGRSAAVRDRRVEVVIACHSAERPLARAVASVLDGNGDVADLTVVAHNLEPEALRALLAPEHRDAVRFLSHRDAHRSASGPFNAGLAASRHRLVAILGSDDRLEPGAVASWLAVRERTGAELVLTRLALGRPGAVVPTPPVRPWRRGRTDLVRDRLAYRSAPLGLMDRETLDRLGLRLVEGAGVGGDVAFVTRLCAEVSTAYDAGGPPYVIGEDAGDRVTYQLRPIDEQISFVPPILEAAWFARLRPAARRAIAIKLLRIHVFGAVHYRPDPTWWTPDQRAALAAHCTTLLEAAPGCEAPLSRAERSLLDACLDPSVDAEVLVARSVARRRHGRPSTFVPRALAHVLDREAPPRFMGASLATRLRRR